MRLPFCRVTGIFLAILLFLSSFCLTRDSYSQQTSFLPSVIDNTLKVEPVVTGLNTPTSISFLGPNDILVTEKNTGIVYRVLNGQLLKEPLLDVNVFNSEEGGMLGIQTAKNPNGKIYVFLYYTEAAGGDENYDQGKYIGNRVYRYELVNNKLVNPKLLLSLPKGSGWNNGGAIKLGPDGNLYIPVGDLSPAIGATPDGTLALNNEDGSRPNLSGGILRITPDGKPVGGIIGESYLESLYFAYGIRNSFGIDFDPITGTMWDTETGGPTFGDEINVVKPGFNSGWSQVQGTWKRDFADRWVQGPFFNKSRNLVDFSRVGNYSSPEFIWKEPVGSTALKFIKTPKLGTQYQNDIFVGDINYGRIYHFDLNKNRTALQLNGTLSDKVANSSKELDPLIFGRGFYGISDLEVGPDGYLYVVSNPSVCNSKIDQVVPQGTIYRISPNTALTNVSNTLIPLNNSYNSRIIGNITDNTTINNFTPQTKSNNGSILAAQNETHWSAPLQLNATYIEGSFKISPQKNETGKEVHAGVVWLEGNNKTYYAFVRPGPGLIVLADTVSEISCATLIGENVNSNNITIINSPESLYIYHNGFLKLKVPREFIGTDVSPVGIRTYNTKAEFSPLKVGNFPQNLSQFLLPNVALTINQNSTISIKTTGDPHY
jgi:aldose sugar dehydrogenase